MRNIHPELMLLDHKKTNEFRTMWNNTEEIANDPSKFYAWLDESRIEDPNYRDVNRGSRTKWEIRLLCFTSVLLGTIIHKIKNNPKAISNFIADCVVFPLETLIKKSEFPYSYHLLTRDPDYAHLCLMFGRILMGPDAGSMATDDEVMVHLQTHNIAIFSYLNWKLAGQKTYTISSGLGEALKATRLNKYPADLLKTPSPCLYIEFPVGAFTFTTYADHLTPSPTGYVHLPVEGAYILEDISPIGMRLWRIVVVCQYTDTPSRAVHINHYYIPLYDNKPIEDCLADAIAMMKGEKICEVTLPRNEIGKIGVLAGHKAAWDQQIVDCAESIFRFLMNAVIYVTHGDADETLVHSSSEYAKYRSRMLAAKGKKRESLKNQLKKMHSGTRILLGKNYVIKRWDNDNSKTAGEPTGRHINVRTLVSGHWRNQVCGVGGLERKIIWIEPFWRGPEAAPLTEKRAVVK